MVEVLEFKSPVKLTAEERSDKARALCPDAMDLVDAHKAMFGEGGKIMHLKSNGEEYKNKDYKPDEEYRAILTATQFIRLGEIRAENQKFVNGENS